MEERLEALHEAWNSFMIEFPTYPRVSSGGREENQRVLFLCSAREENPSELCRALFNTQIHMQQVQSVHSLDSLGRASFILVYAAETPSALREILSQYQRHVSAPVLVANKANIGKTTQYMANYMSHLRAAQESARDRQWGESTLVERESRAAVLSPLAPLPEMDTLWQGLLPDISLVDGEGHTVHAALEIKDYRAEYACRYVLTHFQENINRDKMAEMVNLSPGYFSNLFRSEVGMSFSDYLIQVRIENAKRLLRRFDLSVEAISKQCGFNSLAHFSRTFKDRCGLSPLKYRKSPNSQA